MEDVIVGNVYKILELVGSSPEGWEEAVKNAIDTSSQALTNLRIAKVQRLDAKIEGGKIVAYRARVTLSFKVEIEPETL